MECSSEGFTMFSIRTIHLVDITHSIHINFIHKAIQDPPTASWKEFPTRVRCSSNQGLMHLQAGEKSRLLSLMRWQVRTCCQLSSHLLYPPKSSSPVLQAYQLFSQFDSGKMVFAPFCFLQHCFLRLSCISSGSPLSIVIAHWFFYNPTCSRVNFDPPRTLDCCHALPSSEKYHFASFCVRCNFPRVFFNVFWLPI